MSVDNDSGRDSKYYFDKANIFSLEGKYKNMKKLLKIMIWL